MKNYVYFNNKDFVCIDGINNFDLISVNTKDDIAKVFNYNTNKEFDVSAADIKKAVSDGKMKVFNNDTVSSAYFISSHLKFFSYRNITLDTLKENINNEFTQISRYAEVLTPANYNYDFFVGIKASFLTLLNTLSEEEEAAIKQARTITNSLKKIAQLKNDECENYKEIFSKKNLELPERLVKAVHGKEDVSEIMAEALEKLSDGGNQTERLQNVIIENQPLFSQPERFNEIRDVFLDTELKLREYAYTLGDID